nr:DUF1298 domain-containing protein [Acidimicrobiia bacterium]
PFNLIISNVPGPSYSLYSAGARLEHFYPISALTDGQGLNMTVQSYNGNLDFGFVACRELVPDVWRLTELLQAAMAELLTAVGATGGEAQPATTQQPQPAKRPAKKRAAKRPAAKRRAAKKAATKKRARSTGTAAKKAPAAKRPAKKAGAPPTKTAGKRASTAKKASGAKGSPA